MFGARFTSNLAEEEVELIHPLAGNRSSETTESKVMAIKAKVGRIRQIGLP